MDSAADLSSEQLLRVLDDEGRTLLKLAGGTDMSRPVASCPGWTIADLVTHLTSVYRWAGLVVREGRHERPSRAAPDEPERDGPALLGALAEAHAQLVETLRAAPGDLDCWTVWPAQDARQWWTRRQAHETLVHRVDVQNAAAGRTSDGADLLPAIAADGVDEMVMGFANRYRDRLRSSVPGTMSLHATDVDRRWWIRLGTTEPEFGRGSGDDPAPTRISALGGELLLLLWNRRTWQGLDITGPDDALRAWRRAAHL